RAMLEQRYGAAVVCEWAGSKDHDVIRVPWQLWAIDTDDRTLTVHLETAADYQLEHAEHTEDDREVRVSVFVRVPVGGAIRAIGALREARVELSAPLGDRRVVDGATGRARQRLVPQDVVDRSWQLIHAYVAEHPDHYGGSWAEHPGCHIAFTADVDGHRRALLELLPDPHALVVHEVDRTDT